MNSTNETDMTETIRRTIDAAPERVWELWTTAAGIAQWWAPDGFTTTVQRLDLVPGGELIYTMTATDPEQIAFMQQHGMPLATESHKRFAEIDAPNRLSYDSVIDFVPDRAPYVQHTLVELEAVDGGTRIQMTMQPLHDEIWTERLVAGRTNEIDNLAQLLAQRSRES